MNRIETFPVILALLLLFVSACQTSNHGSENDQIVVNVNTDSPGITIPDGAIGLSYETKQLLPDTNGNHYFSPDNAALLKMFETLGVKNLRIGGNSVDAASIGIPNEEDIHSFFQFAKAANVKVIYSVRLQNGEPQSAKRIAKIIYENYKELLESFAIGNEPRYYEDYELYVSKWTPIRDAIVEVYPDAVFCGPDQNPDAERLRLLVSDFGYPKGKLVQAAQHNYPFGCSYTNFRERDVTKLIPFDAEQARATMLKDSAYTIYQDILDGMKEAVNGTPVTFRMTETNSFWYSGLKGASDSYASALWSLDYLHWWTSHGAAGLNFHTGDITGGEITLPCQYASFVSAESGYLARPLAYGMKLFSQGAIGQSLAVDVNAYSASNVVAYATIDQEKNVYVTIINKEFQDATDREICIQLDVIIQSEVRKITLNAINNDISAEASEVFLGDAQILSDGTWNGKWEVLPDSDVKDKQITLSIAPSSAVVLKAKIN